MFVQLHKSLFLAVASCALYIATLLTNFIYNYVIYFYSGNRFSNANMISIRGQVTKYYTLEYLTKNSMQLINIYDICSKIISDGQEK